MKPPNLRRDDTPRARRPPLPGDPRAVRRPPPPSVNARAESASQAERERFLAELERAKLDAMKELAYGASHEINNPLANIALRAQTLLKREDDPDKRKLIEAMHRAAMRAHEMISDLMLFARPPRPERRSLRVVDVADEVASELAPLAEARGVDLSRRDGGDDAVAWADPSHLAVALRAVVENSLDAIGQDGAGATGVVEIVVRRGQASAVVEVRDDGPGVPEAIRPHVFDPFFSGREAGRGLGFGLSKCWRIVTDHGGRVRIDGGHARGAIVTLTLPAAPEGVAEAGG